MKEKYYSKKHCWGSRLVSLLAFIMLSTSLYADGNVIITKLLNGMEYSGPDQVTYSNGVITATPSLGNYIDKSHITVMIYPSIYPDMRNEANFTATDANADPSGPTTYSFVVPEDYDAEIIADFQNRTSVSGAVITLSETSFVYDGSEKTPAVESVVVGNKTLAKNEYSIEYSDNVEVGKGKVIITGQRTYQGSTSAEFDITPAPLIVAGVVVSEENRHDVLGDGGSVKYDGQQLLMLTNAKLTGAIETTMEALTIYLVGENSITATGTAALIGTETQLTITTEGNKPGSLTATTLEAQAVATGFSSIVFEQNLAVLSGAFTQQQVAIGTPMQPITDTPNEPVVVALETSEGADLTNTVVNDVLYTLSDDDHSSDPADNSLLLTNTMAGEDMQQTINSYAPGTADFAAHFSGITLMVPAGTGQVLLTAKTGADGMLQVKIGSQQPVTITGLLELTEVAIPYACSQASYVFIYNASEAVAEAVGKRAGKKTTVTVGLSAAGVNSSSIQSSNPTGVINSEKIILSDADIEYNMENATLKAINSEVNSLYEESFVSFPFLKYIDLRNTKITGINVSREEGAFKGVSKNTFIYVPAGNTTSESNVVVGSICESVLLDGDMSETESFGLSGSFTASSIDFARTFQKDEVATLYLPFPISEGDKESFGTFYTIEKVTGGKVKIVEVEGEIKAHTPYLFKAAADNTELYNLDVVEMSMPEQAAGARRTDVAVQLIGCYDNIYSDGEDNAFRFVPDANVENLTFVRMQKDERIKPFEAYLLTDAEGDTLGVTDKDAAGIKQVDSLQVTVDSWYDLQGRKVKGHPVKGLYIKNGTKCVIN